MDRVIQKVASLTFVTLLAALSFGVHVTAMPQTSGHAMAGMDHGASSSSCATICTSTTPHKDEFNDEENDDEKDKNQDPFYLLHQSSAIAALENEHEQRAKIALEYEPPPGLPAYILLSVFRA